MVVVVPQEAVAGTSFNLSDLSRTSDVTIIRHGNDMAANFGSHPARNTLRILPSIFTVDVSVGSMDENTSS